MLVTIEIMTVLWRWRSKAQDDHVIVIGFTTCMSMSMTTGRSHMVVALLYAMQSPCNALLYHEAVAIVVEAIVGETTM